MELKSRQVAKPRFSASSLCIAAVVLCVAVFHFSCTAIYLLPPSPMRNLFIGNVTKYMLPFFYQNWHLFSPNPGTHSQRLEFRCEKLTAKNTDPVWSDWFQGFSRTESNHEVLRFSGSGKVLQAYYSIPQKLWELKRFSEAEKTNLLIANREFGHAIATAKELTMRNCTATKEFSKLTKVQFRVTNTLPIPFSQRKVPGIEKRKLVMNFEPFLETGAELKGQVK